MSRTCLTLVALAALLPTARAAEAEPGTPLALIQDAKIRKELKLSEKQAEAATAAKDESELARAMRPGQYLKLTRLSYTARGGAAVLDPSVMKALDVTEAQKEKIHGIWKNKELNLEMLLKVARFRTPEARTKFILDNRREAGDAVLAVLTDAQKKAFAVMQGK